MIKKRIYMDVSVLIPVKDGEKTIGKCLAGIFSQVTKYKYEVVIIDSGSTDSSMGIISKYQVKLHKIEACEYGHGKTRNHLAGLAQGRYLVFLTQDAVPANEHWLDNLIGGFSNDSVAGVYGRNRPYPGCDPIEERFIYSEYPPFSEIRYLRGSLPGDYERFRSRFIHFSNTNSAIHKSIWANIPFNKNAHFGEDKQWAQEVLTKGLGIVYQASAVVYHSHSFTLAQRLRRAYSSATGKVGFVQAMVVPWYEVAMDWVYLFRSGRKMHQTAVWGTYSIVCQLTHGIALWLGSRRHGRM